jgi:four helix bundle protein
METQYWIELLYKTDYLSEEQYLSIKNDAAEMGKLLSSVTKKLQPNSHN